jgi:hypothetical protein
MSCGTPQVLGHPVSFHDTERSQGHEAVEVRGEVSGASRAVPGCGDGPHGTMAIDGIARWI